MGRNLTNTATASTPFDSMPVYGDTSGGRSSVQMYNTYLHAKSGATIANSRDSSAFFLPISLSPNTGAYITNAYAANTWYTIASTTGSKGRLFNVIAPYSNLSGAIVDIEVTIDGAVHTYTATISALNFMVLGMLVSAGYSINTTSTVNTKETQSLPGAYYDEGFSSASHKILMSPQRSYEMGFPFLRWTTDMQVRVRSSQTPYGTAPGPYAAAVFMYD